MEDFLFHNSSNYSSKLLTHKRCKQFLKFKKVTNLKREIKI